MQTHQLTYSLYPFVVHVIDCVFQNITNSRVLSGKQWAENRMKPLVSFLLNNASFELIKAQYVLDFTEVFIYNNTRSNIFH